MADLSNLSDDELRKLHEQVQAPPVAPPAAAPAPAAAPNDLAKMSDEELRALYQSQRPKAEEERTLGSALGEAVGNFLPSVGRNVEQMAEGVGSMVMHPVGTAKTLGKLAVSLTPAAMLLKRAVPEDSTLGSWLKDIDAPKQAIIDDYVKAYGGWQPFLKTMGTDPARILTDLATVATGGEAAAAKLPQVAGLLAKTGKVGALVGKGLEATAPAIESTMKAAQLADPVNLGMAAVGKAGNVGLGAININTGVGEGVMQQALRTGFEGGEAGEQFRRGLREVPAEDAVAFARQGFNNMKQRMFADYQADKDLWSKSNAALNFDKLDKAELDIHNNIVSQTGNKLKFKASDADVSRINQLLDIVDQWRKDPASHTLLGFDDLKQALRNSINWKSDSSYVTSAASSLANAAKDTAMTAADPAYRRSLERYQTMSDKLNDVDKAFSLKSDNLHTVMSKLQSVMRNNANTQYGMRKGAAQTLKDEGGVDILPMMAGHAASSWAPRGLHRLIMGGEFPGIGVAATLGHPGAAAAMLGHMALSSPRLMGETIHGMGRVAGLPGAIYNQLPESFRNVATPMLRSAVSQPARNLYTTVGREEEQQAHGGRIGFDDGGYTGDYTDDAGFTPMPALRGAVNANLPKVVDPTATILARKVGPSTLVRGTGPTRVPEAPEIRTDNPVGTALKGAADLWNRTVKKQDDDALLKELRDKLGGMMAPAGFSGSGGARIGQYDDVLGLPNATPLPGGSYEAKVRAGESGSDDSAVNKTTGAAGRYQFMPATAESLRKKYPELKISDNWRTNASDQEKLMKAYTDESREALRKMGSPVTGGRLYAMHMFGQGGGQRILAGLDKPISEITTAAERAANPFLNNFVTGRGLLNYFENRFG